MEYRPRWPYILDSGPLFQECICSNFVKLVFSPFNEKAWFSYQKEQDQHINLLVILSTAMAHIQFLILVERVDMIQKRGLGNKIMDKAAAGARTQNTRVGELLSKRRN